MLLVDVQLGAAHLHPAGEFLLQTQAHAVAAEETVRTAGVTHDHGEVAFLHAAGAHREVVLGLVGDVGFAGVGGLTIRTGVHAEHAEVAGVARPHPVVGVAAELADGAGRHTHQAHVAVGLVVEEVEFVALEHHLEFGAEAVLLAAFADKLLGDLADLGVARFLGHVGGDLAVHLLAHIIDAH